MATLFYKTKKSSSTGLKVEKLIKKGKKIEQEIESYLAELGAERKYVMKSRAIFGTGICAVSFTTPPDEKVWKKFPKFEGYYSPKLSSSIGKDISKRIQSFEIIEREDLNKIIGYDSFLSHCGFGVGNKFFFGFETDSDWKHQMPSDCVEITFTEYQKLFNKK